MNIVKMDDEILRDIEQDFSLKRNSLRLPVAANRLLLSGLPLVNELHFEKKWCIQGLRLRVWHLDLYLPNVIKVTINDHLALARMEIGDVHNVKVAEEGSTTNLSGFRVTKKDFHEGTYNTCVMYTLLKTWF